MTTIRLDRRSLPRALAAVHRWSSGQWLLALLSGIAIAVIIAVPTAVIPTPLFGRAVAVTWWSYPTLALTGLLAGMLVVSMVATAQSPSRAHVDAPASDDDPPAEGRDRGFTLGTLGAGVTFFAVGCPVCNKIVLIALGTSGAISWFAPVQPLLAVLSVALLGWALVARLSAVPTCAVPQAPRGLGTR